jgi:hypothetical protein
MPNNSLTPVMRSYLSDLFNAHKNNSEIIDHFCGDDDEIVKNFFDQIQDVLKTNLVFKTEAELKEDRENFYRSMEGF